MVSVAIMAHPKRRKFVAELLPRLDQPATEVVWDTHDDRWDTGRRALLAFRPAAEFHLVIQDDAIPCRDLVAGAERAMAAAGERPVGLYVGRVRPMNRQHIVGPAIDRAVKRGATWIAMEGPTWGVAIAVPTSHIPEIVKWGDRHTDIPNYDTRIARYYRSQGIDCWYTVPSLVDHRPVKDNPSLLSGRTGNRRAHYFIGKDRSALEVEWDAEPCRQPGRVFHHRGSGRMTTAEDGTPRYHRLAHSSSWQEA